MVLVEMFAQLNVIEFCLRFLNVMNIAFYTLALSGKPGLTFPSALFNVFKKLVAYTCCL